MNQLVIEFSDKVDFLGVYLSEAHPQDEWQLGKKHCINQPKTIEERIDVAKQFVQEYKWTFPTLIDDMDNSFDQVFFAWPERFYVAKNGVFTLVGNQIHESPNFEFDRNQLQNHLLTLTKQQ